MAASGISGFGSPQSVDLSSATISALNDLNGSLQLNISAYDFLSVLSGNISISNVANTSNINADSGTTPPLLKPNFADTFYEYKGSIPSFDGTNRIPNITAGSTALNRNSYIFQRGDTPLTLTSKQVLALPLEGLIFDANVTLKDTEDNISALIPQLTKGQLASFHAIVLSDVDKGSTTSLNLSAEAFKELNYNANSQVFKGLHSITVNDGTSAADISIHGSAEEIFNALVNTYGDYNFVKQISDIDIS